MIVRCLWNHLASFAFDQHHACDQKKDESNPRENHDRQEARIPPPLFRSWIVAARFNLPLFRGTRVIFAVWIDWISHVRLDAGGGERVNPTNTVRCVPGGT